MNFEFSDEQLMLREQARGFLKQHCPPKVNRAVLDGGLTHDADLWRGIADMGWTATTIPECYGGLGLDYYELAIIAEELGRAVAPLPFSSSVYLATEALLLFASEQQKARWLPGLASGEIIACLALSERPGTLTETSIQCRFHNGTLNGQKTPVVDASAAQLLLTLAKNDQGQLVLCASDNPLRGIELTSINTVDGSRPHSAVSYSNAAAEVVGGEPVQWGALQTLFDRAAVLFAWEQLGVAEAALEQGCQYAKDRYAFGRAIGSFQAIKHKLAGMYVKNNIARGNAYFGVWALASRSDELPLAAATARVAAIQASTHAAAENIQTHGGMGFTWEFDCQFYYRRAKLLSLVIGGERHWQNRVVMGLEQQAQSLTDVI